MIATHNVSKGNPVVLQAKDKVNYQLIDDQTGFGPQNIIAKREGKNLKIFLEDGDMNADIIIEGYYGSAENPEDVTNLIVGQHENGKIYAYVPESGAKSDAVSMLAEEVSAPQALGGDELSSAYWVFSPWWLLALLPLGALAFAGGGSDGGDSSPAADTTVPAAPTVKANADGSMTVTPAGDATKTTITYVDENGNTQTATFTKDSEGKWVDNDPTDGLTVDPNTGVVTIPEDKVKDGSTVTAVTEGEAGNESESGSDTTKNVTEDDTDNETDPNTDTTKDVTPPTAPDVKANDDGSVTVTPSEDATKTTITYTDEDGKDQTVDFTKGDDGKWVDNNPDDGITIDPDTGVVTIPADEVQDGTDVSATNTDTSNNTGPSDTDTAKTPATNPAINININSITGDAEVTEGINDYAVITVEEATAGFVISGTTENVEANQTVTVTITGSVSNTPVEVTASVGADGKWTANVGAGALTATKGETFTVVAKVSNVTGTEVTDTDITAPVPTISIEILDSDVASEKGEDGYNGTGNLVYKLTLSAASATETVVTLDIRQTNNDAAKLWDATVPTALDTQSGDYSLSSTVTFDDGTTGTAVLNGSTLTITIPAGKTTAEFEVDPFTEAVLLHTVLSQMKPLI